MFRKTIVLSLIMGSLVTLSAELLKPVDSDQREILTIAGKRWTYYTLYRETISFDVTGPMRLKMYSRVTSPTKTAEYVAFGFGIQVDKQDAYAVTHKQKLSSGVKSQQHPNHFYSHAAKDFFTVPEGQHTIKLVPNPEGEPVIIRVLEDLTSSAGKKLRLVPLVKQDPVKIRVAGSALSYYELTPGEDLQLSVNGAGTLETVSRLGFENWMGSEQDYRIQVWDGGKLLGTYYFTSDRSDQSEIDGHKELVPGKWRSCRISLPAGNHKLKIRLLDKERQAFVRFALITK